MTAESLAVQRPESRLQLKGGNRLPVVLQAQAAECGLACLVMVAGYYGYETDLVSLRRRFSISSHGTTLKQLMDMASRMQLAARALRVELDALPQLQAPCILHWDMNHFVVLKTIRHGKAVIHDPATGLQHFTLQDMAEHVTGVALELLPTDDFKPVLDRQALRISQLWSNMVGLKRSLVSILLLALLLQVFSVASPFYMQTVVDDVLLRSDRNLLLVLALGFGLLLLIEAAVSAFRQLVILNLASRLNIQMAANVFRHLIRLPLDYFQHRHLGDVLSRFGSLDSIRQLLTTGLVSALVDGIMATITLTVMFIYNVQLTLIVLGVVALYVLVRLLLFGPMRRLTEESLVAAARTESSFMESVRAIQTIKLHQKEIDRQNLWQNRLSETLNRGIALEKLNITHSAADVLLFGLGNILVIYFAAQSVMANAMTLGMLYAFVSFKQRFVGAMDGFIEQAIQLKMLSVHLERLSDIVLTDKEPGLDWAESPAGLESAQAASESRGIAIKGLSYRYSEAEAPVFENLHMQIAAGECVAIVGESGTGKSTLIKCMMGLLHPEEGQIKWGNRPVVNNAAYRQSVAAVMQDDQLLSGSIADNIACFDHKIDNDAIARCAQMACIHDDIMALPMQYNTLVGDMGSGLSGGQIQRIMLARALYRKPQVLFLDEATSHLDVRNEAEISENIANLNMTRIIVAHRQETIRRADRVIELGR